MQPVPWQRYALLTAIVCQLDGRMSQLGKTALQKMVYLLQELGGFDCGYDFEMYTYGPFAKELLCDLDAVNGLDGITVTALGPRDGYRITPSENADRIAGKVDSDTANDLAEKLRPIVEAFAGLQAIDLELLSTIVFVAQRRKSRGRDIVIDLVMTLKPKFSRSQIQEQYDWLLTTFPEELGV